MFRTPAIQHRILEISRFFLDKQKYRILYCHVILLKGSEHTFSGGLLQAVCRLKIGNLGTCKKKLVAYRGFRNFKPSSTHPPGTGSLQGAFHGFSSPRSKRQIRAATERAVGSPPPSNLEEARKWSKVREEFLEFFFFGWGVVKPIRQALFFPYFFTTAKVEKSGKSCLE